MMRSPRFVISLALLAVCAATPARATESADLTVGFKTLPLLVNKVAGTAQVAVVYSSASAESKADADNIKQAIDGGMEAPGGIKLVATLVPVGEYPKSAGSYKIAFLAAGLSAGNFAAVSAASAGKGTITMSADLNCVRANQCVLGLVSKPTVEIYYSKAASTAAGVDFVGVFTMLVKQI